MMPLPRSRHRRKENKVEARSQLAIQSSKEKGIKGVQVIGVERKMFGHSKGEAKSSRKQKKSVRENGEESKVKY